MKVTCAACGFIENSSTDPFRIGWVNKSQGSDTATICDHCWPVVRANAVANYADLQTLRDATEKSQLKMVLSWFLHYLKDKQYEKIPPEKDFELREALRKAEELVK